MSEVSAIPENAKKPNGNEPPDKTSENSEKAKEQTDEAPLAKDDVQRAIEGLAEIPDDQLQEFLNDEDFMEGLNVVDAWEMDTEKSHRSTREQRNRDRGNRKSSRERSRRDRKSPHVQDRLRRDERKRDDQRRDPSKSSKDIERDKLRTKRDTASKILAEKEKAIKNLLDSDDVVPPGTEVEVIQGITDKQRNSERAQERSRRSRERRRSQERGRILSPPRRRSNDRFRLSPIRRISDERRQMRLSPDRRRGAVSPLRRSWERRDSRDRSLERLRRREEREQKLAARRSRSRDRQRSRSIDRYRKRYSRSPIGRRLTPRRHSRSRSPDRRERKRSPFINEIARQFGKEGLLPTPGQQQGFLPGIPPLMEAGFLQDQVSPVPPASSSMQQFMHHQGTPGIPMQGVGQQYVNFDLGPPPMNFEQRQRPLLHTPQVTYASGPMMYNQGNPPIHAAPIHSMPMHSPQPVPAPGPSELPSMNFNQNHCPPNIPTETQRPGLIGRYPNSPKSSSMPYKDFNKTSSMYDVTDSNRPDRLKTPEPPVISNSKPFEKTSLSSLLEASVSAKDSHSLPVLYPGFKPEILRQCEQALRDLPAEDQRFKMKGRFFFDPSKKDEPQEAVDSGSNSILLRARRGTLLWPESENVGNSMEKMRPLVETHQKICQTDGILTDSKGIQAVILPKTAEFCQQVYPTDLQYVAKEEKRPIMDRLDWDVRDTYDYAPKLREADDLRWSLSNSSQKRPSWNRGLSPPRVMSEDRRSSPPTSLITLDHGNRGINVGSTTRVRENFSYDRGSSREHYSRERFSPTYRRSIDRQEDLQDVLSNHSRGESPMALEESPEEVEIIDDEHFSRGSDWRSRGSTNFGNMSALNKLRALRGKPISRPYRGKNVFRGKF